jgi:hypothetical protein
MNAIPIPNTKGGYRIVNPTIGYDLQIVRDTSSVSGMRYSAIVRHCEDARLVGCSAKGSNRKAIGEQLTALAKALGYESVKLVPTEVV